jgi:hypothetical protein
MYLAWGREFTWFYNDAYRPILGNKNAEGMGLNSARAQSTSRMSAPISPPPASTSVAVTGALGSGDSG